MIILILFFLIFYHNWLNMSFECLKQVNIPDPVEIIKAKNNKESKKRALANKACTEIFQKSIRELNSNSSKKKFTRFMTKNLKNGKNSTQIILNTRNIPEEKYLQLRFNSQNIFGLDEWENQGWKVAITPCAVIRRTQNSCEFCPKCNYNYLFFDLDFFISYTHIITFIVKIFHSPNDVSLGNDYSYLTPNYQTQKDHKCHRKTDCLVDPNNLLNLYCGHFVCQSHYLEYQKKCKICEVKVRYNTFGKKIIV